VTIRPLPDVVSDLADARAVLDGDTRDPEAIEAACDVLDCSEWYQDRIRIREARARLALGRMAPHFAAMQDRDRPVLRNRLFGVAAVLAMLALAHVALSAPGKIGRTLQVFNQIEDAK
jgi:hypothetical protein